MTLDLEYTVSPPIMHGPQISNYTTTRFAGLVLEAGFKDLWRYVAEMRPHAQDVLKINAPQWINEITSGIQVSETCNIPDHLESQLNVITLY